MTITFFFLLLFRPIQTTKDTSLWHDGKTSALLVNTAESWTRK